MISIRTMTNELDRMEEALRIVTESYSLGVNASAEYAIEINPGSADQFREHLEALRRQIVAADNPETWKSVQASFRGELREYHDKANSALERLRNDIQAATDAVHLFAETVASSDTDHEARVGESVSRLEGLSRVTDWEAARTGMRSIAASLSESIAVMQATHKAAIAQLRDEIRVLHKQMDTERHAHQVDRATAAWNREKLDSRVAELTAAERPFCLLLVCIRNLQQLNARYSRTVVESCQQALVRRLGVMLDKEAMIGRWDENSLAAILEVPAAAAMKLSRAATQHLSGPYAAQENGKSHSVSLVAVAGVIDWTATVDDAAYQKKLRQMSEALAGT